MRTGSLMTLWLLPLLAGGCATHALWTKTELDAWNQPAVNGTVQLFDAGQQKDLLVVYDEYSERHDAVRSRAYFLNQNDPRVAQGRKPRFTTVPAETNLPPLPVLFMAPLSTNSPETVYAVLATNRQSFTLYAGGRRTNHNLPVYNDGRGQTYRIALTPVAVVADLTIVGGVLGCFFIYALAEAGYSTGIR